MRLWPWKRRKDPDLHQCIVPGCGKPSVPLALVKDGFPGEPFCLDHDWSDYPPYPDGS